MQGYWICDCRCTLGVMTWACTERRRRSQGRRTLCRAVRVVRLTGARVGPCRGPTDPVRRARLRSRVSSRTTCRRCSSPPIINWPWSCLAARRRSWRSASGRRRPATGSYIPAPILGEYTHTNVSVHYLLSLHAKSVKSGVAAKPHWPTDVLTGEVLLSDIGKVFRASSTCQYLATDPINVATSQLPSRLECWGPFIPSIKYHQKCFLYFGPFIQ